MKKNPTERISLIVIDLAEDRCDSFSIYVPSNQSETRRWENQTKKEKKNKRRIDAVRFN